VKDQYVLGFSLTPNQVAAVKLSSADFSLLAQTTAAIKAFTLSQDSSRLLNATSLCESLDITTEELGNPEFSVPVYLALQSSWMGMYEGPIDDNFPIVDQLLHAVLPDHASEPDKWIVQFSLLRQQGSQYRIAYAILEQALIENVCTAFHQAGLHVVSFDLIPCIVLRAMAASGVLDALLHKIGKNACWGCFGVAGTQTWVTLWQGNRLQFLQGFITPDDTTTLENKIKESVAKCEERPVVWLAWQEMEEPQQVFPNLLTLKLDAPVRPARLGPLYEGKVTSLAPIGAALKADVVFPLGWNFLGDPYLSDVRARNSIVPYTNYQPVLPRLFLWIAMILFLACIACFSYLRVINHRFAESASFTDRLAVYETRVKTSDIETTHVLAWLKNKAFPLANINDIRLDENRQLSLQGTAEDEQHFKTLTQVLSSNDSNQPSLQNAKQTVTLDASTFKFNVSGEAH